MEEVKFRNVSLNTEIFNIQQNFIVLLANQDSERKDIPDDLIF